MSKDRWTALSYGAGAWIAIRYSTVAWTDEDKAMSTVKRVLRTEEEARDMIVGMMTTESIYLRQRNQEWATERADALEEAAKRIGADDGTNSVAVGRNGSLVFEIKPLN